MGPKPRRLVSRILMQMIQHASVLADAGTCSSRRVKDESSWKGQVSAYRRIGVRIGGVGGSWVVEWCGSFAFDWVPKPAFFDAATRKKSPAHGRLVARIALSFGTIR